MADTGLTTPTQAELIDRTSGDYNSKLPAEDAYVRFSPGWIWARVMAGAARTLHDTLAYIMRQVFPTHADENWLPAHGTIRGVPRIAATFAGGDLTFTGTNGSIIPLGTAVQRVEDGEAGTVTVGGTVAGGSVTVTIQADEAGESANSDAGVAWEIVSPITGIDSEGVVAASGITGGADIEDIEDWRDRILAAWQQPGGPGSEADYQKWARLVENVDKVFVTPNELGAGTVGVRFTIDPDYTDPIPSSTIIPSGADVTAVETSIALYSPVTADVTVTATTANTIAFTISVNGGVGGPTPPSAAVKAAIEAELDAMFIRLAEAGGTIYRSQYRAAISAATGEEYHDVTVPAGDITNTTNQVAVLGTVTWS